MNMSEFFYGEREDAILLNQLWWEEFEKCTPEEEAERLREFLLENINTKILDDFKSDLDIWIYNNFMTDTKHEFYFVDVRAGKKLEVRSTDERYKISEFKTVNDFLQETDRFKGRSFTSKKDMLKEPESISYEQAIEPMVQELCAELTIKLIEKNIGFENEMDEFEAYKEKYEKEIEAEITTPIREKINSMIDNLKKENFNLFVSRILNTKD